MISYVIISLTIWHFSCDVPQMRIGCLARSLFYYRRILSLGPFFNKKLLEKFASRTSLRSASSFLQSHQLEEDKFFDHLCQELVVRVEKRQRELNNYRNGTPKFRIIKQQIAKLNDELARMESRKRKNVNASAAFKTSSMIVAPHLVTLEVLSNGTTHMHPCALLRTPDRCYMLNCPEGSTRFAPMLRVRPNIVHDILITRANWQNVGGIAGMLLGIEKKAANENTRMHGPCRIKQYLERQSVRFMPFLDLDFGHISYPVVIEEVTYEHEQFEDSALYVRYIPIVNLFSPGKQRIDDEDRDQNGSVDVAFLIQLKEIGPHIDPIKLIELKIPKGPHIGQLKAGQPVTLDDGRVIRPEQVYSECLSQEQPKLLVVEIESDEKLASIHNNSVLQTFMNNNRRQRLNYIVHFSRPHIFELPAYKQWMHAFGPQCRHLVLNGTGPVLPLNDGIYRSQQQMATIFPHAFPQLYPPPESYEGNVLLQDTDYDESRAQHPPTDECGPVFLGCFYQRFPVRGQLPSFSVENAQTLKLDFTEKELDVRVQAQPELEQKLEEFRQVLNEAMALRPTEDPYPMITFLGTSSACASKYRNVSSNLLQLNATTALMIDCGECTFGQLKVLLGPKQCTKLLSNLRAIIITHQHQDHVSGLYTVVQERFNAFKELDIPYRPLILVCNRNVRKSIGIYAQSFHSIDQNLFYVDVSTFHRTEQRPPQTVDDQSMVRANNNQQSQQPQQFVQHKVVAELATHFPKELFSPEEWNLRSLKAVPVLHTRMANGFVFECNDANGRKVVFSGDTKPCELLEEYGRDADVLVHECTFEDGMEMDAERKKHSTMRQAFDSAQRMRAKHVLFTHFSSRYTRVPPLPDYLLEEDNCSVANDNMVVPFDLLPLFPKLLPLYRSLFKEELFQNQLKQMNRKLEQQQQQQRQRQQELASIAQSAQTNGQMEAQRRVSEKAKNRTIAAVGAEK